MRPPSPFVTKNGIQATYERDQENVLLVKMLKTDFDPSLPVETYLPTHFVLDNNRDTMTLDFGLHHVGISFAIMF